MKSRNVGTGGVSPARLGAWRVRLQKLQAAVDAALEAVARTQAALDELRADRAQRKVALDATRAALPAADTSAKAALDARSAVSARVDELRAALSEGTARLLGSVGTEVPLLLLPV